jgi:ComF family protein
MITMLQNLLTFASRLIQLPDRLLTSLSDLIPCSCLLCGIENNRAVCAGCQHQFFSVTSKRCISCALPVGQADTYCGSCLSNPPAFYSTTVACDYAPPLDQLILALKFQHQLAVAPALAGLLAKTVLSRPKSQQNLPDFLIPVPLGRARLAERGFNQSYQIAKPLATRLKLPVYPQLLLRVRDTTAQTLLHPNQRHENILHAFSPNSGYEDKIQGRHIGVVDDVMTTGATLHEIAACLKRHGARRVSNFVFARTPPH